MIIQEYESIKREGFIYKMKLSILSPVTHPTRKGLSLRGNLSSMGRISNSSFMFGCR